MSAALDPARPTPHPFDMTTPHNVFLATDPTPERFVRTLTFAITAASVDERVEVLLTAPVLRALADGLTSPTGFPPVASLVADLRALGGRVLTCDGEASLAGSAAAFAPDGSVSLPTFWRECRHARIIGS